MGWEAALQAGRRRTAGFLVGEVGERALRGEELARRVVTRSRRCLWLVWPPVFSRGVSVVVGGGMTEEKEEGGCTEEIGSSSPVGQVEEVRGLVLIFREAKRQLGNKATAVKIVGAFVKKAEDGDLNAFKLLVDYADRADHAEEISDEEMETLGTLLMREFHALSGETNAD